MSRKIDHTIYLKFRFVKLRRSRDVIILAERDETVPSQMPHTGNVREAVRAYEKTLRLPRVILFPMARGTPISCFKE